MASLVTTAWGALRLDAAALQRWPLERGLALILVATLLGGLADGVAHYQACQHHPPPGTAERRMADELAGWLSRSPLPPDAQRTLERNAAAAFQLRGDLAALPRPLGRRASCALEGLQRLAAAPYHRLALWLPYTLAVYAVARALGSRAGLADMLAATSLYALPHLLDFLRAAPGPGPFFGVALALWGAGIYLRAVAVAGRLDGRQALLATLLPGLAALTLAAILLSGLAAVYN